MHELNIGGQITELRKAKGVTQEALARAIGVSGQAVSKWEGGGSPDISLLPAIADYFGVAIDCLFGRMPENRRNIEEVVFNHVAKAIDEFDGEPWDAPDECQTAVFERVKKICWAVLYGMLGTRIFEQMSLPMKELFDDMVAKMDSEISLYGRVVYNRGMVIASATRSFPYFFFMPEPEKGWSEGLLPREEYCKTFAALGDEDILSSLLLLHTKKPNTNFTAGYLAKETGLSAERTERVIASLTDMGFVKEYHIELEDTRQKFYEFRPKESFIAVLMLMRAVIHTPTHHVISAAERSKPLLRLEGDNT
ncbi:MAG: helix-turn-helix domain-containing protein [Defluviitaleaceae bacterium]|nr:helix-turn-helix domain-containing protein [Defluviitaleaceae bacterium]